MNNIEWLYLAAAVIVAILGCVFGAHVDQGDS